MFLPKQGWFLWQKPQYSRLRQYFLGKSGRSVGFFLITIFSVLLVGTLPDMPNLWFCPLTILCLFWVSLCAWLGGVV